MKNGKHRVAILLLALAFAIPAAANEKAEPDPARSPYWEPIRQLMFGDRVINPDDRDVIRVYLNLRADDASTVPVAVKSQIDQTDKDYIKSIYLMVERNPSPTAGVFISLHRAAAPRSRPACASRISASCARSRK